MTSGCITLTKAEVDKAKELMESPMGFVIRFEVNPIAKGSNPHYGTKLINITSVIEVHDRCAIQALNVFQQQIL